MRTRDLKTCLLLQLFAIVLAAHCFAIQRVTAVGARETALSMATIALPGLFSVFHNQALLAENRIPSASISYRQPYSIHGYHESALSLVYPIPTAVLAIGLSQSAVVGYNESAVGISIAKKLTKRLSAGILFNYFDFNLPETGQHRGSVQVDGGIGYKLSDKLSLGLHLRNIVSTKCETFQYTYYFRRVVRGGAAFGLSERILLVAEAIYENMDGVGLRCGMELKLLENFVTRSGVSTNPFQHSFGFGYTWNSCQLDFSLVHHEILGFTPLLSVNIKFR